MAPEDLSSLQQASNSKAQFPKRLNGKPFADPFCKNPYSSQLAFSPNFLSRARRTLFVIHIRGK